ncbi:hypothetical protein MKZ23_08890 [Paenibacillus sp. FSL R5-0876]|uniref:hypothetical protein n=1 Tax=Paenibacillus sp. FSL R5-0876 TaxID=2921661 RepID=UPI0030F740E5
MNKKALSIYKVTEITMWGHEDNPRYFKSPIAAEKDFHRRVKIGITHENLPDRSCNNDPPPWKIRVGSEENVRLKATIRYWDSYHTDCGTEHDINEYEILFEEIAVV